MVAGVASGLSEYTGVDPVVFRVLFAVLTLFGGAGVLLYLVGWLFLPDEGQEFSPAESLVGRSRGRGGSVTEAALLAAATLLLALLLVHGDGFNVVLLVVVVVGLVLILRNIGERRPSAPSPYAAAAAYPPPVPQPPYGPAEPGGAAWSTATTAASAGAGPLSTGGPATEAFPPYPYGYPPGPPPPPPPRARPARSILGRVVLSTMLVALGVLAALDGSGALDVSARHYLALALAVIGAGLLAGAWFGRARWLVAVGIPLAVALIAVSTAQDAFRGGTGVRQLHPKAIADVWPRYELGSGSLELDLSGVDFTEQNLHTDVHVGLGNTTVIVPRYVDVTVHARTGLGATDLFDSHSEGAGVERRLSNYGSDGVGGGDLDLTIDMGIGHVEVYRAAA